MAPTRLANAACAATASQSGKSRGEGDEELHEIER
jgi:hypothetical protein